MRINVIAVLVLCCSFIVLAREIESPNTPEIFYAIRSSTIELPCVAGSSSEPLRWVAEHETRDMLSRSETVVDPDDATLTTNVIKNVKLSDAGTFTCTDGERSSQLELVVIEPSAPILRSTKVKGDDKIEVFWDKPQKSAESVLKYRIYVKDVNKKEEVFFEDKAPSNRFILKDLSPNTEYKIQVAALYSKGVLEEGKTAEGPRSQAQTVRTPRFDQTAQKPSTQEVKDVKVNPWHNNSIIVSWAPVQGHDVDGYRVFYQGNAKRNNPQGIETVREGGAGGRWQVTLEGLKTRMKYTITVAPITGGSQVKVGRKSKPVVFTHEGFTPEMSIHAIPLDPHSVIIAVSTVGPAEVKDLRVVHTDESAIEWVRVEEFNKEQRYGVVTGLRPETRYFFMAKARVSGKARQTITDVLTPPTKLVSPTDITVMGMSDNNVLVKWKYNHPVKPVGFILDVNKETAKNVFTPERQQVCVKDNEALITKLPQNYKYEVRVLPFNTDDKGPCSDTFFFRLIESDLQLTTQVIPLEPPQILSQLPRVREIESGETVSLSCEAQGNPPPIVQWHVDGQPFGSPNERSNQLLLQDVQSSATLTCKAVNSAGEATKETRIMVLPPAGEPPRFTQSFPKSTQVTLGGEFRQTCSAEGEPTPIIEWYKQDVAQSPTMAGSSVYSEKVSKTFRLKCVASNVHGTEEQSMDVLVIEPLQAPELIGTLDKVIEITEGEDLVIKCKFSGIPAPDVTWLNNSRNLTLPKTSQSNLVIKSAKESSFLTCRGQNKAGIQEHKVNVTVKPRPPPITTPVTTLHPLSTARRPSGYKISMRPLIMSPEDVDVRWIVDQGDTFNIRHFSCNFTDENSKVLYSGLLGANRRKFSLRKLDRGARYKFNLKAHDQKFQILDDSTLDVVIPYNMPQRPNIPELEIELFEIQDEYARLAIHEYGINSSNFRIQVTEENARPESRPLIDQIIDNKNETTLIRSLRPEKAYQVLVEARNRDSVPIKTVQAAFTTPPRGGKGRPVTESSLQVVVSPTTAATRTPSVVTTATTRLTVLTTAERPTPTTTTTSAPTTPARKKYFIVMMHSKRSKEEDVVKWLVQEGNLNEISEFNVTIVDETTKHSQSRKVEPNERNVTFTVAGPGRRYTIYLQTLKGSEVIDRSSLNFISSAYPVKPSRGEQELRIGIHEIRERSARLDFYSVGINPSSYRIQVFDIPAAAGNRAILDVLPNSTLPQRIVTDLQPNRSYRIIFQARDSDKKPIKTAKAYFRTPPRGGYGIPVIGSSEDRDASKIPSPTRKPTRAPTTKPTPAPTTKQTPAPTTKPTPAPTTVQTPETSTEPTPELTTEITTELTTEFPTDDTTLEVTPLEDTTPDTTHSEVTLPETTQSEVTIPEFTTETTTEEAVEETTWATEEPTPPPTTASAATSTTASTTTPTTASTTTETELPEDKTFVMTSRAVMKHPNIPVIKWQVDRGNIDDIKNFEITVKSASNGKIAYNGTLSGNQRYVSFSAFPKGKFMVTIKAIGSDGVLAENEIMIPPQVDETEDKVNPRLEFGAAELRSNSANLLWDTANINASDITGYRVRMFEEGPDGYQVIDKSLDRTTGSLRLLELNPKSTYYAILDTLGKDNRTIMSSGLTFTTPPRNGYGDSVSGTMLATPSPDEPADPEMKLFIKANATSGSHRVSWNLKNVDTSLVRGYNLILKSGGALLASYDVNPNVNYFLLSGLEEGIVYDVELTAISGKGDPIIRVETPYMPGTNVDAVVVSSRDVPRTPDDKSSDRSKVEPNLPELVMTLASDKQNGHRLSWLSSNTDALVLDKYLLEVTKDGDSNVIGKYDFTKNVYSFLLDNIVLGSTYKVKLDAIFFFGNLVYTLRGVMEYTPVSSIFPKVITQRGDKLPDQRIDEIIERDPPVPEMELSIQSDEPSGSRASHSMNDRLSWKLKNVNESVVDNYVLTVRENGEDGDVILSEELAKDVKAFRLQNLDSRPYYLQVDALLDGYWLLFSGYEHTPYLLLDTSDFLSVREPIRPQFELLIRADSDSEHLVKWNLRNINKQVIDKYVLTVSKFGDQNDLIIKEELTKDEDRYKTNLLLPGSSYRVEVQALSSAFSDAIIAATVYTQGVSPEPLLITAAEPLVPKIQLSIKSEDASSYRASWTFKDVPVVLVKNYILTVREDSAEGVVLKYNEFDREVDTHVLSHLFNASKYHVSLEAKLVPKCSLVEASTEFVVPREGPVSVAVTGVGVRLPDTWEPEAADEEPKLPEMQMSIKARGSSGHRVSWFLKNFNTSLVDKYKLTIRKDGEEGVVVRAVELSGDVDFHITNIFEIGRLYHVEVEARTIEGYYIVRTDTEYTPGKSSDPLVVTGQGETLVTSLDIETDSSDDDKESPVLDVQVSTTGPNSAVLSWNVSGFSPSQLNGYISILIFREGVKVLQDGTSLSHRSFTINGLTQGLFLVNVTALDNGKKYIASTAFSYQFLGYQPGAEPFRFSSTSEKRHESREDCRTASPNDIYVITRARPYGKRLDLEWLSLSTGRPKTATLVRYAAFTDGSPGRFITKKIPPGMTATTLTGIDQWTRYGFSVASDAPGAGAGAGAGEACWSDIVYRSKFN